MKNKNHLTPKLVSIFLAAALIFTSLGQNRSVYADESTTEATASTESSDTESATTEAEDTESATTEAKDTESATTETNDTESADTEATDAETVVAGDYIPLAEESDVPVYTGSLVETAQTDDFFEDTLTNNMATSSLPSKYPTSSTYTTPIAYLKATYPATRNQNPYGTCWAHSAVANAEFSAIANGVVSTGTSTNYSEYQLAYFAYHSVTDPLGGSTGDSVTFNSGSTSYNYLSYGHNLTFVMHTMGQWVGMVNESDAPYSKASATSSLSSSLCYDKNQIIMTDARVIDIVNDRASVKQAIQANGIVSISYAYYSSYDNTSKGSYYCPYSYTANHAVAVVGWDDTYSKNNFSYTPSGNGAWLVRNSWTTETGYSSYSYFWLSYYDKSLSDAAYAMEFTRASTYDNNYRYDGTNYTEETDFGSGSSDITAASNPKTANVFTAKSGAAAETISAVNLTYKYDADVNYKIDIYTGCSYSDPTSGTLATTQTGSTTFAGIYTIELDNPVTVANGETFSVVVTSNYVSGGTTYYLGADREEADNEWSVMKETTSVNTGSLVYKNGSWSKLTAATSIYGYALGNYCIRAYTCDTSLDGTPYRISLNKTEASLSPNSTLQLTATTKPADCTNFGGFVWKSSDETIASVDQNGLVTAGDTTGSCTITVTALNSAGEELSVSKTCKITVAVPVTSIKISATSKSVKVGSSFTLTATAYPTTATNRKITWSSSNSSVASVSSSGKVTGNYGGTCTIYASSGSVKASCKVTVVAKENPNPYQSTATTNSITLKWTKVSSAYGYSIKGYGIYAATSANGTYKYVGYVKGVSKTTYTVKTKPGSTAKLSTGATYYFKVQPIIYLASSYFQYISTSTAVKAAAKPGSVTGLKCTSKGTTSLKYSWKKASGASGYYVYLATSKNGAYTKVATTSSNSATISNLSRKKTYYVKVVAYRSAAKTQTGTASSIVSAKTK